MSDFNKQDRALVDAIRSGGAERLNALREVYMKSNLHSKLKRWVMKHKGNEQDAEDLLHDAMVIFDRNVRNDRYKLKSSIVHYIFSIGRLLWMNRLRKAGKASEKQDLLRGQTAMNIDPETELMSSEKKQVLQKLLAKMDPQCLEILNLWKQSYSMQEIAELVGLSSAAMAKKYRYRCKKKLINLLEADAGLQLIIKEIR